MASNCTFVCITAGLAQCSHIEHRSSGHRVWNLTRLDFFSADIFQKAWLFSFSPSLFSFLSLSAEYHLCAGRADEEYSVKRTCMKASWSDFCVMQGSFLWTPHKQTQTWGWNLSFMCLYLGITEWCVLIRLISWDDCFKVYWFHWYLKCIKSTHCEYVSCKHHSFVHIQDSLCTNCVT